MKNLFALALMIGLFCFSGPVFAQDKPAQQPSTEELEKQKAEREKNAYRLLDQVIDEAQSLKLIENRVRVQINAADMLWDQNQGRARSLFASAADGVAEVNRNPARINNRRTAEGVEFIVGREIGPATMRAFQLRQELVLAAARHDAALAYQLLAATKPPANTQSTVEPRGPRAQIASEDNLEQTLLARIASLDPKLAAQNADQMMEKGQFPRSLPEVINQLRRQDAEAADKLADKTAKRVQAANLLTNNDAGTLAQSLLVAGLRQPAPGTEQASTNQRGPGPVLEQSAYIDVLSVFIDAALKIAPPAQNNQRGPAMPRRVQVGPGGNAQIAGPQQPTPAQIEQNNARRYLVTLASLLPIIDQHLPAKATLLRQKMTELGMSINGPNPGGFISFQGNADALVQAAASAPPQVQARIYQQAAYKALEEGDTERARQIATDHLSEKARETLMERIDFRELARKSNRIDEIRQTVARLQSDNEKIDLLVQIASDTQKDNPKLAIQVLDEAKQLTNRRATNYEHFEQQLKVAHAFAALDASRSFEVLEPGISQLNELLAAAAVLSGFEINMFRDGEMAIQGGNGLTSTVLRYGQELAVLARTDLERSETLAGRFQFPEPRIMARMAMAQGLLGITNKGPALMGVPTVRGEPFIIRQD